KTVLLGELCRALLPEGALDDLPIPRSPNLGIVSVAEVRDEILRNPAALGDAYQAVATRLERHPSGEFFTPPAIAEFMADLVLERDPKAVLDPAAGAGILLSKLARETHVYAIDINPICVA